jgi:hypothetical protein
MTLPEPPEGAPPAQGWPGARPVTWEGDRWLDEALLPHIEALTAALRARREWERHGFRQVVVVSDAGWHHLTGQEQLLGAAGPSDAGGEDREDWLMVMLTRRLPAPDRRAYYATVPIPRSLIEDADGRALLSGSLLTQAIDAVPG